MSVTPRVEHGAAVGGAHADVHDPQSSVLSPQSSRLARARRLRQAWRLKGSVIGVVIVLLVTAVALAGPLIAPANPYVGRTIDRLAPPFWIEDGTTQFLLGSDQLGRDSLSRLIFGARVSLSVAVLAVLGASVVGVLLGLFAGFYRGWVDWLISTLVNVMLSFPFVLLALAVIAVLGPSFTNLIVVLAITGWPVYTRVLRAQTLSLREREFVAASRVLGAGDGRIIFRHIFPNIVNLLVVIASLQVAQMIILESFLSFLGLGVQPPIPSWGSMLGDGRLYMFDRWWMATFPGLAIFVTTLAINLVGDGLRDLLDPYSRTNI
ncbi:MAG: ABC transporter permease [Chloroflexota bacterium]|nr:ABC transporter permease [Chloroflexota bacterium]